MNKVGLIASSLLIAAALAASASASAAYTFLVSVEGQKTGKFQGEAGLDSKVPATAFSFSVRSPHDPGSGQASGKRQYSAITFTKPWGASSPQLFSAASNNELLKSVLFEFSQVDAKGVPQVYETITLTGASISGITRRASASTGEVEDISMLFTKIEIDDLPGKTTATDTWSVGAL